MRPVGHMQVVLMYFMMQTSGGEPAGWKTAAIQCVSAGEDLLGM